MSEDFDLGFTRGKDHGRELGYETGYDAGYLANHDPSVYKQLKNLNKKFDDIIGLIQVNVDVIRNNILKELNKADMAEQVDATDLKSVD